MTWTNNITLKVELGIGFGNTGTTAPALGLSTGTGGAGTDGRIGYGSIGATQTAGLFTIGDNTYGKIGVAGRIPSATDSRYVDLGSRVTKLDTRQVKPSRFSTFETGTCSIEFTDPDRVLDPMNLNGPYVVNNTTTLLTRGRRVRVKAVIDGVTTIPIFAGFVSDWPSTLEQFVDARRTIDCWDWFGLLAQYDGYAQPPVGAGETVTARLHRFLDVIGVPMEDRAIDTSPVVVVATDMSGNLLNNLKDTVAADGGDIWVSGAGVITFRSKTTIWTNPAINAVQFTFTNTGSALSNYVRYAGNPEIQENDIFTGIFVTRKDGPSAVLATNPDLKDQSGWFTLDISSLHMTDAEALNLATYMLNSQPRGQQRLVRGVIIRPDVHAQARTALSLSFFDRVKVEHYPPVSGASVISRHALITGIEHTVEAKTWATRFTLQDITGLYSFVIGTSAIGSTDFIP